MADAQETELAERDERPAGAVHPRGTDAEQQADREGEEASSPALDPETLARRDAALAQVIKIGDPVLNSKASPVSDFDQRLSDEVARMIAIMRDAIGVGLAATQLGVLRRILVFQAGAEADPSAVVNPEIEWHSDEVVVAEEGCLSIPRVTVDVERPLYARIRGQDTEGEPLLIEAAGLEARVLQHELDHLDGLLMIDRTEPEQRKGALRALREGEEYSPPTDAAEEALQGEAATAA